MDDALSALVDGQFTGGIEVNLDVVGFAVFRLGFRVPALLDAGGSATLSLLLQLRTRAALAASWANCLADLCAELARMRRLPAFEMPCSRSVPPLCHGLGVRPA